MRTPFSRRQAPLCGAVLAIALLSAAAAAGESRLFPCVVRTEVSPASMQCELDISDGSNVSKYSVSSIPDNTSVAAEFLPSTSGNNPTTVGILLDQGSEFDRPSFNRLRALAVSILDPEAVAVSYGVWTFSTNVEEIARIGTSPKTTQTALQTVRGGAIIGH